MRIGIDLGGTKIEGIVLGPGSVVSARKRIPTPREDYTATVAAIVDLVCALEHRVGHSALPVGIGTPGTQVPPSGAIKNANSTWLNGRTLGQDVERALGRPVRLANDADCLVLSEALEGVAADARLVFGVILGTGVGGGIVANRALLSGPNGITGEWGHNPLPWPSSAEMANGPDCWCGLQGCIESWLSGPGLAADFARSGGGHFSAVEVARLARRGDALAEAALSRYENRLARALAAVINLIDPEVIVLAGGISAIERLYSTVPRLWDAYVFSSTINTRLVPARHGDASGVRGAAWLWPERSA